MKAIINGFRYDTEKADCIGSASHGYGGDFSRWSASLYRTKRSKNHFLAGEGGPMSRYGRNLGQNTMGSGERIDPVTREEALAWAEQHLTPETVEEWFGDDLQDA